MPLTSRHLHDALKRVLDPDLKKDLVTLNRIRDIRIEGDRIGVTVELATPAGPMREQIAAKLRAEIDSAIRAMAREVGEAVTVVDTEFAAAERSANQQARDAAHPLPGVRQIIAVGAGKGGVGKSTVAVALAVGLARMGARTGLLDGDIYGPSIPTMLGLGEMQTAGRGNMLMPFEVHGIKTMTIGKLVDPEKPLIWRGPMAHGAFKQLATQTEWGTLDYLIVDLPPGTGDVPLTLAQLLPLTGAVVVCTPQRVAQDDARRAVRMFQQLGVELLGVVENMSYFVGNDGTSYDLFGRGGAKLMAQQMSIPFLGAIPIHMALRENCDAGVPLKNWETPALARELDEVCRNLVHEIATATLGGAYEKPTVTIR